MQTVTVPAGEIEYDQTGSGPPVVLLHGLLMDHTLWDGVLPLLPAGFRYLRPVLPLGAHRRPMHPGRGQRRRMRRERRLPSDWASWTSTMMTITVIHTTAKFHRL